jgi:hypothetical protein
VKKAPREHIIPYLMTCPWWEVTRRELRENLRYFLTTKRFPAEELFYERDPFPGTE